MPLEAPVTNARGRSKSVTVAFIALLQVRAKRGHPAQRPADERVPGCRPPEQTGAAPVSNQIAFAPEIGVFAMSNAAELLIDTLVKCGVDMIYGLPGDGI